MKQKQKKSINSKQDERLVNFLKKNAPSLPKPGQDLENRIMNSIAQIPQKQDYKTEFRQKTAFLLRPKILLPTFSMLALVLLFTIGDLRKFWNSQESENIDLALLEDFVLTTWDEASFEENSDDLWQEQVDEFLGI